MSEAAVKDASAVQQNETYSPVASDQDATATIYVLPNNIILVVFLKTLSVRGVHARAWRRIARPVYTPYRPRRICAVTISADNLIRYAQCCNPHEDFFNCTGERYRVELPTLQRRLRDIALDISELVWEWGCSAASKWSKTLVAAFRARRAD